MADEDDDEEGEVERMGIQPGDLFIENPDGTETQLGRPNLAAQQLANALHEKHGLPLPYPHAAKPEVDPLKAFAEQAFDRSINRFFKRK